MARFAKGASGLSAIALLLLACTGGEEAEPVSTPPLAAESEAATEDGGAGEPPAPEVAALPPEPVIDDDPDRLLGLGPFGLDALLGTPRLVRQEAPAQIRQYHGDDCVLDVVLYPEPAGERVAYVEARDGDGNLSPARACLNQLLRARLEQDAG